MKKVLFGLFLSIFFIGCSNNNDNNNVNNNVNSEILEIVEKCSQERESKNFEAALDLANKIIEIDDKTPIGYCELGKTYYEMGEIDKAKEYVQKAVEISPNDDIARETLAMINGESRDDNQLLQLSDQCNKERKNKNYEAALQIANKMIEMNDRSSIGYCEMGKTYYEMGDSNKARSYVKKALEINPDDVVTKEFLEIIERRSRR